MLRNFELHSNYQENLKLNLKHFRETDRDRVKDMNKSISKLCLLNLDPLLPIIKPLYSNTGCPAKNQPGIVRSLILMLDQKYHGITKWALKAASDKLLYAICGFTYGDAPSVASYKRLFEDCEIEKYKAGSSKQRFAPATFAAVNVHLDAWVKHTNFSIIHLPE